jgi:hypothetical protein
MGVADVSENGALGGTIKLPNPSAGDTLYSESEVVDKRASKSAAMGHHQVRTMASSKTAGRDRLHPQRHGMEEAHAPKRDLFPGSKVSQITKTLPARSTAFAWFRAGPSALSAPVSAMGAESSGRAPRSRRPHPALGQSGSRLAMSATSGSNCKQSLTVDVKQEKGARFCIA